MSTRPADDEYVHMSLSQRVPVVASLWALLVFPLMAFADGQSIQLQPTTIALFDEGDFAIRRPGVTEETFLFRLFVPKAARDGVCMNKYPVIVWLHGHGELEFESRNGGQLLHIQECVLSQFALSTDCEFYLLVVRCPSMKRPWFGNSLRTKERLIEPGEAVVAILDELMAQQPIDPDRVSVVGLSSGGTAAWELAIRHPDRFAAIAPTASSGADLTRIDALRHIPVWAFHSLRDSSSLRNGTLASINALRSIGGHAWFTEVPARGLDYHNAWQEAFSEHGLLQWLLNQRRGNSGWQIRRNHFLHVSVNKQGFLLMVLVVVFILIAISWRNERKRRLNARLDPRLKTFAQD
jgi:predicted peptidase